MDFSNPDLKELACLIYETLKESGINAVLVVAHVFQSTAKIDINPPIWTLQRMRR
jgi:hypothetical protein